MLTHSVLEDILKTLLYDDSIFEDNSELIKALQGLLILKNPSGHIYAIQTFDNPEYFDSESNFKNAYEKDWAEELWEDMNDELLSMWISRLLNEENPKLKDWMVKNNLENKD